MKLLKASYLSILCRSSWAFNFSSKKSAPAALTPIIRRMTAASSNIPPPEQPWEAVLRPLGKVDYEDKDSRNFNHRGDWGRIAELTDAIYSDPKNISNWKERARLYKESGLPFNAFSDLSIMGLWSKEGAYELQVR